MYGIYSVLLFTQICGKTYKNKNVLKIHRQTQHEQQSLSANVCPRCGKQLHSAASLHVSMRLFCLLCQCYIKETRVVITVLKLLETPEMKLCKCVCFFHADAHSADP